MKTKLFSLLLILHTLEATELIITDPGTYKLGANITFNGTTGPDEVVFIDANDVVLDLNGFVLSQGNATASIDGIVINQQRSNITIRNGIIRNVTRKGIVVNQGCNTITLENISIQNCVAGGAEFVGTAANQIQDCTINNCKIIACCTALPSDFVLSLTQCVRTYVRNSMFSTNGVAGRTLSVIRLDTCEDCDCSTIKVVNNTGSSVIGFDVVSSSGCRFTNCLFSSNTATGAASTVTGFNFSGTSNTFHMLAHCFAIGNTSVGTNRGFDLEAANTVGNMFFDCICLDNTASAGAIQGFNLAGGVAVTTNNIFMRCIADQLSASGVGNNADGFLVAGSDFGMMIDCISSYHTSANNLASGLTFSATGAGGDFWTIMNGLFIHSAGSSDANSFGINRVAGTNNLFMKNVGFSNGTTANNQMNGLSGNSITTPAAPATSNINGIPVRPWTNLQIAA